MRPARPTRISIIAVKIIRLLKGTKRVDGNRKDLVGKLEIETTTITATTTMRTARIPILDCLELLISFCMYVCTYAYAHMDIYINTECVCIYIYRERERDYLT